MLSDNEMILNVFASFLFAETYEAICNVKEKKKMIALSLHSS
jgi:hypothetical protein